MPAPLEKGELLAIPLQALIGDLHNTVKFVVAWKIMVVQDSIAQVRNGLPIPDHRQVIAVEQPFEILFDGLAPGFAGVYQIDVRMPSTFPSGTFGLYCVWGGIGSGGPSFGGTIPTPQR